MNLHDDNIWNLTNNPFWHNLQSFLTLKSKFFYSEARLCQMSKIGIFYAFHTVPGMLSYFLGKLG